MSCIHRSSRMLPAFTSLLPFALSCLLLFVFLSASARAAEEETHLFNATLSLTGDCSESATIDPVPDPGLCPMPPGVPGVDHPPKPFSKHAGVAVDSYGNRYVASAGSNLNGSQGRIDIFDSAGKFITGFSVTLGSWAASLAVDSEGYLYVGRNVADLTQRLLRYAPTGVYNPAAGEIEYGDPPAAIPNPVEVAGIPGWLHNYLALAINPADDHLFVAGQNQVIELSSAAEGNTSGEVILSNSDGIRGYANAIALDAARNRIYVSDLKEAPAFGVPAVVKVFDLEAPHELLFTIDGATTPTERFVSETRALPLAVDEATGHVFVGDLEAPTRQVYEFEPVGSPISAINPVSTIGEGRLKTAGVLLLQLAYDDSAASPTEGHLFVPSGSGPARSLAFEPKPIIAAPLVEDLSASGITAADAILRGRVNPGGLETDYRIEYVTEQDFLANNGFQGAALAGGGTLKPANEAIAVSAPASGLSADTAYRFRVVAENELGEAEADASFTTYATPGTSTNCPNQALRTGPSALLPDCRAYELVTPADTNGHPPLGTGPDFSFTNRQVSPVGDKLQFRIEGAPLPGLEGTGSFNGDPYLATRTPGGWSTDYVGPSPAFAPQPVPGNASPDQGHYFWAASVLGPAILEGSKSTSYVSYPDGHSALLGQGSLGTDPLALGQLISEGGGHIIFETAGLPGPVVQLEPGAAPDGTGAIYDRTADGTLHVVSLKPGDEPFGANERAFFRGASLDGVGIAFEANNILYLRYDNEATYEIGAGVEAAGVAEGGGRVFYLKEGDLEAFDVATQTAVEFSASGDVTPVTVAPDGTAAYFVSPSVLTPGVANPTGEEAQPGGQNLYLSEEGQISFVATVTERDVKGNNNNAATSVDGLGLWLTVVPGGELGRVPARTTPDGGVLLFKSRAALTDYDPAGHAQVYRYDSVEGDLHCLSCNPTGTAASSDATLQYNDPSGSRAVFRFPAWLENLRADGRRAFFESSEGLVANDTDGLGDVYQWEEEGVGSCGSPAGCLSLISSGQSSREEYLWAVSESGDDVFVLSAELLTGDDPDETPSIYDARVNGGFPPPTGPPGECLGGACQPTAAAPNDPTPASTTFRGAGNVKDETKRGRRACPKGKRAARRAGKQRCVPRRGQKHRKGKKRDKQAKGNRRAGR